MRTPLLTVAAAATLALNALAPAGRAEATELAPKQADRAAVGVAAHPDAQPADAHPGRLSRLPATRAAAVAPPAAAKQPEQSTSVPIAAGELSAAQRLKLASAAQAKAAPAASPEDLPKPAAVSTVIRPAPGERPLSYEASLREKLAQFPPSLAAGGIRRSLTAALGAIPRPEWSGGGLPAKPKEVSTVGTATAPGVVQTAPSPVELQRRSKAVSKPASAKAPEVTTSQPRDPSAPAQTLKSAPASAASRGVQP